MKFFAFTLALSVAIISSYGVRADERPLSWPLEHFHVSTQGEGLGMADMDVNPAQPDGRAEVLRHGKIFCAASKF